MADDYLDRLIALKELTTREEVELEAAAGVPEAVEELWQEKGLGWDCLSALQD